MEGLHESALSCHLRALETAPNLVDALLGAGFESGFLNRGKEAIAYLEKGHMLDPEHPDLLSNLGLAYLTFGGPVEKAAACLEKAVRLDPGHGLAWNNLGKAYGRLGRPAEAAVAFREALRIRPELADARRGLARAEAEAGVAGPP
jgi:tetratricopeptide (TPR) repeat protein